MNFHDLSVGPEPYRGISDTLRVATEELLHEFLLGFFG
jgi:hypothetical protein